MSFQRLFPVITSIVIILLVAVLRDRSRAVAAVLATMPINIPLALWVVASGSDHEPAVMADFGRSLLISLIPSWLWLGVVFLALRAGWNLWLAIGSGYAAWAACLAVFFAARILTWPGR